MKQVLLSFQVKNGPGQYEVGSTSFTHFFDGFAKLCMVNFTGEQMIEFSTKILPTMSYNSSLYYDTITPYIFFGDLDPPMGVIQKLQAVWHRSDNCPVNVHRLPSLDSPPLDEVLLMSDTLTMYQFNVDNFVETRRVQPTISAGNQRNHLVPIMSSAHPLKEHNGNTFLTIMSEYNPLGSNALHLVRMTSASERDVLFTIPIEELAFMHSFGLSMNYAVLFYDPFFLSAQKTLEQANEISAVNWNPQISTKVHVINLASGHMFQVDTKPGVHLHHVNTFDCSLLHSLSSYFAPSVSGHEKRSVEVF